MAEQSPRLSLSYVAPNQAQKHVTVNETFRRLDTLVQLSVQSRNLAEEPGAPAEGAIYILPANARGAAWDQYDAGDLAAYQDSAWNRIAAVQGMRAYVVDEAALIAFDGAGWTAISYGSGGAGGETATRFGVNTTADDTNRLAAKSDAVLFSYEEAGTGDCRIIVNKEAAGDTASHLFQTGFSGRAEFGLTGDDDFHVKVSANGADWTDALFVRNGNGSVAVRHTAPAESLHVSGNIQAESASPRYYLRETDAAPTHNTRGFELSGNQFLLRTYNDDKQLISNDYLIPSDAGGAVAHIWRVGNVEGMRLTATGLGLGENAPAARLHVDGGGAVVGNPTGGDRGQGALNAQAVYDDNALLSCYVFDQALDGGVDMSLWDARAPDLHIPAEIEEAQDKDGKTVRRETKPARVVKRAHAPMRKFMSRLDTDYDPLTLEGYARHWKEKRHLTAMPNKAKYDVLNGMAAGEWIQRLVETVEIQAVLIDRLHADASSMETRLATLEDRSIVRRRNETP